MSSFASDLATLHRRMDALEQNRGSVLRFATVVDTKNGQVRVQLADGQDVVTTFLPILQRRVLKDQFICLPDIGEPVAVLFSGKGYEDGVCLGAVYSENTAAPKIDEHIEYKKFEDGTEILYDRKKHKLIANVEGDIEITTKGNITAKIGGNVTADIQGNLTASIDGNTTTSVKGDVTADIKGNLTATTLGMATISALTGLNLQSATMITLAAPLIGINGILTYTGIGGSPGNATFSGNVEIIDGGLQVPDNDVNASGVSLKSHVHTCKEGGTGPPAGA